jgi:hypothetical protein
MPTTPRSNQRVAGSMIAGLLLVPLSAVAAVAIIGSVARAPEAQAETPETSTTIAFAQPVASTTTVPMSDEDAAMVACTSGAAELVAAEADGTIAPLQAAALDALRQICADKGLTVAGPPAPEPIVEIVTTVKPAVRASDESPGTAVYDDDHDEDEEDDHDEYEDHDEEDEEDEDDDHEDDH